MNGGKKGGIDSGREATMADLSWAKVIVKAA